jgi:outer membrane protein TolC
MPSFFHPLASRAPREGSCINHVGRISVHTCLGKVQPSSSNGAPSRPEQQTHGMCARLFALTLARLMSLLTPVLFSFHALAAASPADGQPSKTESEATPPLRQNDKTLTLDDLFAQAAALTLKRKAILAAAAEQRAQVTELKAQALPRLNFEASGAYVNATSAAPQDAESRPGSDDRLDGARYAWALGFNAPVYGFGRLRDVFSMADKQDDLISLGGAVAERRYQEELLQSFNTAILALNEESVAAADVRSRQALLNYVRLEVQSGARPRVDLLQAQAAARGSEARQADALARARSSTQRLAALLDIPPDQPFTLAQNLSAAGSFFENLDAPAKEKLEVRQARIQMELAGIDVDYQRSTRWPIISVFGRASSEVNTFVPPTNLGGSQGAIDQASAADVFDPDRITYTAGLSLNWTIVEGLAIPARAEKAQATLIQARSQALLSEKEQQTERTESAARLAAAEIALKAATEAREAAELLARQAEQDYRDGQISLRSVLEAQDDLSTAVQNVFVRWSQKLAFAAQFKIAHGIPLDPSSALGTPEPIQTRTIQSITNGSED